MPLLAKLQRYSRRQFVVALICIVSCLGIIGQIQVLPVLAVLFLPVFIFFRWVSRQQQHHGATDREIEQIFQIFLGGALVFWVLALLSQLLMFLILVSISASNNWNSVENEGQKHSANGRPELVTGLKLGTAIFNLSIDKPVGYFTIVFATYFIVKAFVEEYLKYWIVQGSCCYEISKGSCWKRQICRYCSTNSESKPAFSVLKQRQQRHGALQGMMCHPSRLLFYRRPHANHAFVVFLAVMAGALGFSFMENTLVALFASTFHDQIKIAILRSLSNAPLHCICGGITGVRMAERLLAHRHGSSEFSGANAAKKDLGRWCTKIRVIFPAVLVHTIYVTQLFVLMTLVPEQVKAANWIVYHVVVPSVLISIVLVSSFIQLRRKLHMMENKMNETHYMHVAVDLESGELLGAVNGDFDEDMNIFRNENDVTDSEAESSGPNSSRKVSVTTKIEKNHGINSAGSERGGNVQPELEKSSTLSRSFFSHCNQKRLYLEVQEAKMHFESLNKSADMAYSIADGDKSVQGVDSNGILTGRWKTGLFGFTESIVPNGIMSCCCPGLVVAQMVTRLGLMPFYHVLIIFCALYVVALTAVMTRIDFFNFLFWLCAMISVLCMTRLRWRIRTLFSLPGSHAEDFAFSLFCGCCSIAQMATHVESYQPGMFAFAPRSTLPGYSAC
ncbi:hypothetical protein CCR75_008468 [Bremia lactucae]|uniref:Transmembrane protein n=1 Tax=Bremia lactucae TaxID=4779 RepID=A0A976IC43_BRELC|nr:hypothetical protein CCR75_008468 [Bremia lactucae]